jgi:uncharacterized membrane protein
MSASAPGDTHPIQRWQWASLALATLGVMVATYLTDVHYNSDLLSCSIGDCHTVQSSTYAEIAGVPVALLGLLMYLAVLGMGVLRWWRHELRAPLTASAFAIALAGSLYAGYLTYLELYVIDAICQWCVISAILTVGTLLAEGTGVYREFWADTLS